MTWSDPTAQAWLQDAKLDSAAVNRAAADPSEGDSMRHGNDPDRPDVSSTRALRVLELLAGLEQPAALDQICTAAKLSKSNVYRALRTLQQLGFVDHVPRGGYRLGSRSFALASLIVPRDAVIRSAQPILSLLVQMANETVAVALRSGDHRVLSFGLHPQRPVRDVEALIGERARLSSGCAGLTILAHLPDAEAQQIVARSPNDEGGPTAAELAEIRSAGYALSFSSNHIGLNGIAAPVLAPATGEPLGSLTISGSAERLDEVRLRSFARPLQRAAKELAPLLARRLGSMSSQRWPSLDASRDS